MTYSPSHVTPAQAVEALADRIERVLPRARRLAELCGDAADMRGRRPPADPDRTGRRASASGPSRPTEDIALDDARRLVDDELSTARRHMTEATALLLGVVAALDRALAVWEGEPPVHEGAARARAGDAETAGDPRGMPDGSADDGRAGGVSPVARTPLANPGGGPGDAVALERS
ncbi:DUF7169 domain-containing protein [Kitasatospora purpeofusca]